MSGEPDNEKVTPISAAARSCEPRPQASGGVAFEVDVARRLIDRHGDDLRFATGLGWLVWCCTHWQRDTQERARELVKEVVHSLRVEAAEASDPDLWKLARKIGTARGIGAVLDVARSDPRIRLDVADLDAQQHLIAARNGEVDLRTGELLPHERAHLITRCAPTDYAPDATFEPFDAVLRHVVPDPEARAFLCRAAGYSLTGRCSEDAIFLLIGPPRSGKSTLLRAWREAFGELYAESAMQSWCLAGGGGNAPRSDLFRLIGRRIVAASEIHPGMTFDAGRLKAVAGGERMPVRDLYRAEIEAPVTFTLWLVANDGDLPRMRSEDDALWERVRRIPVGSTLPEADRDPHLRESMGTPEARAATLAWAVRGAVEWHRHGLGAPPASVRQASADLRSEMDPLAEWAHAWLVFDPEAVTPTRDLRESLDAWCDGRAPGAKRLAVALRAAGASNTSMRHGDSVVRAWRGVRCASEEERREREERDGV